MDLSSTEEDYCPKNIFFFVYLQFLITKYEHKVIYSFYFKLVGIAFSFLGGDWVLKILGPWSPHFGAPESAYDRYNV